MVWAVIVSLADVVMNGMTIPEWERSKETEFAVMFSCCPLAVDHWRAYVSLKFLWRRLFKATGIVKDHTPPPWTRSLFVKLANFRLRAGEPPKLVTVTPRLAFVPRGEPEETEGWTTAVRAVPTPFTCNWAWFSVALPW